MNCWFCTYRRICYVISGVCIVLCVCLTSQPKLLEPRSTWLSGYSSGPFAIDPGSNWDADRVGLFLILNKQANLHYSRDIFPRGAKRDRKKPASIWRAVQHMLGHRGVHASWVQLSRGASEKETEETRLKPPLPLLLLLFHSATGSLVVDAVFGADASKRVCQLQIGSVSMYDACALQLNTLLNKSVLYLSPQQICFFKNMETFCKLL